jgi:hypothetical protein
MKPSKVVFHGQFNFFCRPVLKKGVLEKFRRSRQKTLLFLFQHQTFIAHAGSIYLLFQVFSLTFMSIIPVWDCSCEHWQPTGKLCKNSHGSQFPISGLRKFLTDGCSLPPPPPPLPSQWLLQTPLSIFDIFIRKFLLLFKVSG